MVLDNMQGLVSFVGLAPSVNWLNLLHFAGCRLRERLTLIELHEVLTSDPAELESKMTKARRLEGLARAAEEHSGAPWVLRTGVN